MKFGRRKTEQYCAPISSQASAASSDELSEIFRSFDQKQEGSAPTSGSPLAEAALKGVGKVHKAHILQNWVACQCYLTNAELQARIQQSPRTASDADLHLLLETRTRSGFSSRTSFSRSIGASQTSWPITAAVKPWFGKAQKQSKSSEECLGFRYESYTGVPGFQGPRRNTEPDWEQLESAWRSSLHVPGPVTRKR